MTTQVEVHPVLEVQVVERPEIRIEQIKSVNVHPNADRLELVEVKGWQIAVPNGSYQAGEPAVFVPPDSLVPDWLSDRLGNAQYLGSISRNHHLHTTHKKVKACRLRGEVSYGFVFKPAELADYDLTAENLAEVLDIVKWEPPPQNLCGDADKDLTFFPRYGSIKHLNDYPDLMNGLEVAITEKIHGSNVRMGIVKVDEEWVEVAGSHSVRRKQGDSLYWRHYGEFRELIGRLKEKLNPTFALVLYGEVYGAGVQDMIYDCQNKTAVRLFDIMVDGKFIDFTTFQELTQSVPTVPNLYIGPYSFEKAKELTFGNSVLTNFTPHFKGREGVVIKPTAETKWKNGRLILKSVSADYLARKGGTDSH